MCLPKLYYPGDWPPLIAPSTTTLAPEVLYPNHTSLKLWLKCCQKPFLFVLFRTSETEGNFQTDFPMS